MNAERKQPYLVLSRRWRPQRFADVVGQEHVTRTLRNAIRSGRIAHAYLFAGPRGTGKTSTARILAKALDCEHGPQEEPCNECAPCRDITSGRSLDVIEIDGASNRGIEEIRELREKVRYASAGGRYKLYIIDEVHMLTDHAFNALLKTLEEPPAQVVFVLATTEPHEIPLTILSRCQRFDFRRIKVSEIVGRLGKILKEEKVDLDPEVLAIVARKAGGSVRDAESLLDQLLSFGSETLTPEEARGIFGLVADELCRETIRIIAQHQSKEALELVEKITDQGYDLQEYASGLLGAFRTLLLVKSGVRNPEGLSEMEVEEYRRYGESFAVPDLIRIIHVLSDLEYTLKRTAHPQIVLETTLVHLTQMDRSVLIQDLLRMLEEARRESLLPIGGEEGSSDPSSASPGERDRAGTRSERGGTVPEVGQVREMRDPDEGYGADPGNLEETWGKIVERVKRRRISLGSFLETAKPAEEHRGKLTVLFPSGNGFQKEQAETARSRNIIEEEASKVLGRPVRLVCRCDEQVTPGQATKKASSREDDDGLTKKVMEIFGGEAI